MDQIIEAKYGTARTVAYAYDAAGNRQGVTDNGSTETYTANALNQYTSVGGNTPTYDANGNLTRMPGKRYVYDAQNRLIQSNVGGIVTTFTYDPRNRVVQRTSNGVTTNLTYDGWNLIEERDGTGALQQVYVHGAAVDEMLAKITTAGVVYYHADGLGSTVELTDEAGEAVESYTYDAFGTATIRDASGSVLSVSSVANRFLFTGREWLAEAGIYDYRNRVYSPTLGRFLQTDPIRFGAGDVNIYRYVANNPVNWTDPTGLIVPAVPAAIIIGGAAIGHVAILAITASNLASGQHAYVQTPLTMLATLLSGVGAAAAQTAANGAPATYRVHVWVDKCGNTHSQWVVVPVSSGA